MAMTWTSFKWPQAWVGENTLFPCHFHVFRRFSFICGFILCPWVEDMFNLFLFCWLSSILGPGKQKYKTRGHCHVIFICIFITFSFCWFSCSLGPTKPTMLSNSRTCSCYVHLCFHVIFILPAVLHCGTQGTQKCKQLEDMFI